MAASFRFQELPIALPPGPAAAHGAPGEPGVRAHPVLDLVGRCRDRGQRPRRRRAWPTTCAWSTPAATRSIVTPAPGQRRPVRAVRARPGAAADGRRRWRRWAACPATSTRDGWTDLLVYYWGRTPVLFMHRAGATALSLRRVPARPSWCPQSPPPTASYHGPAVEHQRGGGRGLRRRRPPGHRRVQLLPRHRGARPARASPTSQMNHSMSRAQNAGGAHVLRWESATSGAEPSVTYKEQTAHRPVRGHRLDAGRRLGRPRRRPAARAVPGQRLRPRPAASTTCRRRAQIRFALAEGSRGAFTPKSLVARARLVQGHVDRVRRPERRRAVRHVRQQHHHRRGAWRRATSSG